MRNPAAQGRTDANHSDVIRHYEALYCQVYDTHAVGGGFPDLVVLIPTKRGKVAALVEVKTADGTLRPSQLRFMAEAGSAAVVVSTFEDVMTHVAQVRA